MAASDNVDTIIDASGITETSVRDLGVLFVKARAAGELSDALVYLGAIEGIIQITPVSTNIDGQAIQWNHDTISKLRAQIDEDLSKSVEANSANRRAAKLI